VIVKVSGEFWQQMSKEILPFSFGMRCQKHQFDSIGNSRVFCLFVCLFSYEIKLFVCVQIL